jgi:predicted transcriptional regulator
MAEWEDSLEDVNSPLRSSYPSLRAYVNAQPRHVTQADIAYTLHISPAALSYYLSGKRFPSVITARRIAKQCGIPLEKLLRRV